MRPQASPVGRYYHDTTIILQHAPDLAQQPAVLPRRLHAVDHQDAVEYQVGERQPQCIDRTAVRRRRIVVRRGGVDATIGLRAPGRKERCRVSDAKHSLPGQVRPRLLQPPPYRFRGNLSQPRAVKSRRGTVLGMQRHGAPRVQRGRQRCYACPTNKASMWQ